ncbi:SDR family NAD(P)-dependent oxidoreductase [Polymorphobacter sp. PAMC 29334]|uniref:SDR family NAD(P)-dependent oxidoreductase n=1 Tax=Polymorphobacter sp. PAMC 29334 TaxID=2862331 RepID=UPI001C74A675|nr:SDR family NAD(P)-dependent oxidoreductase [Polymorphobacter sp. PAMC 29334]QYE36446.1 SDR family NAD(P)-dependent oxidoreductase [Polymorphobacter sp. PAMC 29334]
MTTLTGKLALVTGASRGIGAATAEALAAAGAHVILTARTEAGLIEVDDRIHAAGGSATIAPFDLTDGDAVDRLAAALHARWGKLDVLVLNAATLGTLTPVPHISPKDFDFVVAINLTANWRLIRAFDPLLRASDAGRLVTLTSSVATTPRAYWGTYAATKAALDSLVLTYGEEVSNVSAVRVAIVDPGATATTMRARAFPGEDQTTLKPPSAVADMLVGLLATDFATGSRHRA